MTYRTAPGSGDPLAVSPILEASDYEGTCHMMMTIMMVMMMTMMEMMMIMIDVSGEDYQPIVQYVPSEVMTTIRCESFENAHTDRPSMPI